jgi:hypothetical protein
MSSTAPLTRARTKPCLRKPSRTSLWKPFLPRTTGAITMSLVPSGRVLTASVICEGLEAAIGRPQRPVMAPSFFVLIGAQQVGRPQRAKSRRR